MDEEASDEEQVHTRPEEVLENAGSNAHVEKPRVFSQRTYANNCD
jgi:hypothetical protein